MKKINRAIATAMVVAASLSLVACATRQNAYHGQDQLNATSRGTAVGATAGAVVAGLATGGPGAVVGAAVGGGAVGAGVGYSMDRDHAAIRDKLRNAGVSVVELGYSNDLILLMPSDIKFASGSAQLAPRFKTILNSVAEVMKEYPYTVADLPGNADSTGSANYNMRLSMARGQAVADYLASQGIDPKRLIPQPYGQMHPVASNKYAKGRALNRRVQIILYAPPIPLRD